MSFQMGPISKFSKFIERNKNTLRKLKRFARLKENKFDFLNVFVLRLVYFEK